MGVIPGVVDISKKTVPDPPTNVSATDVGTARAYDNGAATVTYTTPTYTGRLPITTHTITGSPGGGPTNDAASPATITGLDTSPSGTSHTFTATATNDVGVSSASSASAAVTITSVPNTMSAPTATVQSSTVARITFTAPNTGGKSITGYTITSSPSISLTPSTVNSTTIDVTGSFVSGQAYTFTIYATNANGNGVASSASSSVTPNPAATVPGAPIIGTATRVNDTTVDVAFTAPSNGGSAITSYTIQGRRVDTLASISLTRSDPNDLTSPIRVTASFVEGIEYEFRILATNAVGSGSYSAYSNDLTVNPFDAPPQPTTVTVTRTNNSQASVAWTIGASDGALTTTNITSTPSVSGGLSYTTSDVTSPVSVTANYVAGQSYTFTLSFTSAYGTGTSRTSSGVVINTSSAGLKRCTSAQVSVACCPSTASCGTLGLGVSCTTATNDFDEGAC